VGVEGGDRARRERRGGEVETEGEGGRGGEGGGQEGEGRGRNGGGAQGGARGKVRCGWKEVRNSRKKSWRTSDQARGWGLERRI